MKYPNRRSILRASLLVAGAAGAGVGYRAWDRGSFGSLTDGPAFQPWKDWRTDAFHGPLALVAAAVLAASPHNSQPWRFRVESGRVQLKADLSRALGPVDPFRRELHIGLGCAIENMMVAARGRGFRAALELLPDPVAEPNLVATLDLTPSVEASAPEPRLAAIGQRHTNRGAYDPARPPLPEALAAFGFCVDDDRTSLLFFPASGERGHNFAAQTVAATEAFVADDGMRRASGAWFRQSRRDLDEHRDGVSITTSGAPAWTIRVGMALPDFDETQFGQYWIDATREVHCATAPLFGLIAVRLPRDRGNLLQAGRLWQRLHLEATLRGIAMQPLNQMMELADRDRQFSRSSETAGQLAALTGDPGWTTVFAFRAGYARTPARPSPRRGVELVTERVGVA